MTLRERGGATVLGPADSPEQQDEKQYCSGPAATAEGLARSAHFSTDKGEKSRQQQAGNQQEKEQRIEDEDDRSGIPGIVKRKKWPNTVIVGVVEEEMAEKRKDHQAVKHSPANRCRFASGFRSGVFSAFASKAEPVKDNKAEQKESGFKRDAKQGVRDATVVLEAGDGPAQAPKSIYVGEFGGNRHSGCRVCRPPVQPGACEACTGEDVGDGLHLRLLRKR